MWFSFHQCSGSICGIAMFLFVVSWIKTDNSQCRPTQPPSGYSIIHFTIRFSLQSNQLSIEYLIRLVYSRILGISIDLVNVWMKVGRERRLEESVEYQSWWNREMRWEWRMKWNWRSNLCWIEEGGSNFIPSFYHSHSHSNIWDHRGESDECDYVNKEEDEFISRTPFVRS